MNATVLKNQSAAELRRAILAHTPTFDCRDPKLARLERNCEQMKQYSDQNLFFRLIEKLELEIEERSKRQRMNTIASFILRSCTFHDNIKDFVRDNPVTLVNGDLHWCVDTVLGRLEFVADPPGFRMSHNGTSCNRLSTGYIYDVALTEWYEFYACFFEIYNKLY